MALILAPSMPLEAWFAGLDRQMQKSAGFFADKPVIVNLVACLDAQPGAEAVLEALDERDLSLVGIEGIAPERLAGSKWERLAKLSQWRKQDQPGKPDRALTIPAAQAAEAKPREAAAAESLLVDRPVRSGQSIIFEAGDVTIVGSVASGAEVIAGGSIHIYGALRGRAIAGLKAGGKARIFCRKLLAELVSIDGLYYAPEHWGEDYHGKAVQIRHSAAALTFSLLD
jgi:septum site-determining protein MinC